MSDRALSGNTAAKHVLLGNGRASASLEGSGFDAGALASRLHGTVVVALRNGVVRNLPLLARINQVLKLTGGDSKDTRFESLDGSFSLAAGKAHTEDLRLGGGRTHPRGQRGCQVRLDAGFQGKRPVQPGQDLHDRAFVRGGAAPGERPWRVGAPVHRDRSRRGPSGRRELQRCRWSSPQAGAQAPDRTTDPETLPEIGATRPTPCRS